MHDFHTGPVDTKMSTRTEEKLIKILFSRVTRAEAPFPVKNKEVLG